MSEYTTITPLEAAGIAAIGYAVLIGYGLVMRKSIRSIRFVQELEKLTKEGLPRGEELADLYYTLKHNTPLLTPELKESRKEILGILESKITNDPLAELYQRASQNPKKMRHHSARRIYNRKRDARPVR